MRSKRRSAADADIVKHVPAPGFNQPIHQLNAKERATRYCGAWLRFLYNPTPATTESGILNRDKERPPHT